MSGQYTLKIITHFACAHTLRGYEGPCKRLHGHNWKVEVEVQSHQLNDIGMVIDFKSIRKETNLIAKQLDHRYLNEIPPFNDINPTAENIACWFYQSLKSKINTGSIQVVAITLWETDFACVRYSEVS